MIENRKYLAIPFSLILFFTSFSGLAEEETNILSGTQGNQQADLPYNPTTESDLQSYLFITGSMPYIDGAIPIYAVDGKNDIEEQTRIVMDNLERVLTAAGYEFKDALKVSVKLSDIDHYETFYSVYQQYWQKYGLEPIRENLQIGPAEKERNGMPVLLELSVFLGK